MSQYAAVLEPGSGMSPSASSYRGGTAKKMAFYRVVLLLRPLGVKFWPTILWGRLLGET